MTEPEHLWTINWLGDSVNWQTNTVVDALYNWQAKWTVVCFNPGRASEIYKRFGGSVQVLSRPFHPDEEIVRHFTPERWIDMISKHDRRLWHYTANEAGNSDELLNWLSDVIRLTVGTDIKLCVWNGNIGHPTDEKVYRRPAFLNLLEWCHKEKHRVLFGFHAGFGALPVSGFIGGAPNHPAHDDYTILDNWPGRDEVHAPGFTKFHSGRIYSFIDPILKEKGWTIRACKTEMAAGTTGDILDWLRTLPVAPGYGGIVGNWRSLAAYWKQLRPDWETSEAYAHFMIYLAQTVYNPPPGSSNITMEFLAYFCGYTHPGQNLHWEGEDVAPSNNPDYPNDTVALHYLHKEFAAGRYVSPFPKVNAGKPPTVPPPVVDDRPGSDDPRWKVGILRITNGADYVNIRKARSLTSEDLGDIRDNTTLYYINVADPAWYAVETNGVIGFVSNDVVDINPPPAPPPEPPQPPADTVTLTTAQWINIRNRFIAMQDKASEDIEYLDLIDEGMD